MEESGAMLDQYIDIYEMDEPGIIKTNGFNLSLVKHRIELELDQLTHFRVDCINESVLVLLEGKCLLYLAELDGDDIVKVIPVNLEKEKFYHIKQNVYYCYILSQEAKVLQIETHENSYKQKLIDDNTKQILSIFKKHLW